MTWIAHIRENYFDILLPVKDEYNGLLWIRVPGRRAVWIWWNWPCRIRGVQLW